MISDWSKLLLWTKEEDKAFENALTCFAGDISNRWENIAAKVPGKSIEEIKRRYELLVEDIVEIESGNVPLPLYVSSSEYVVGEKGPLVLTDRKRKKKASRSKQKRRRGIPWSEDEHRAFLNGLDQYGKGDWRNISRHYVCSRTPTQVASHAQKFFIRQNNTDNKERRRSSIHDITFSGNINPCIPSLQGAIFMGHPGASTSAQAPTAHVTDDFIYGSVLQQMPYEPTLLYEPTMPYEPTFWRF